MRISNMKLLRKGFTIAEMLICFTVIGLLASMLIPSIIYNKPNKNMAMVKKAYQITERAVSEMIMNDELFPAEGDNATGLAYFVSGDDSSRKQADTGKFFCSQFAEKLNINGDNNCDNVARGNEIIKKSSAGSDDGNEGKSIDEGKESFTTNDGVHWYITPSIICDPDVDSSCTLPNGSDAIKCPESSDVKRPYICVAFDVNGREGPNQVAAMKNESDVDRADRGWFYVYWNGKVVVPEGQLETYLKKTDVFDK